MTSSAHPIPQAAPFDVLADEYDSRFTNSMIGRAQRESVWKEMDHAFHPGQRLLDINCGTGVDALHLSSRGLQVVACDVSPEMIAVARRRLDVSAIRNHADFKVLAIEQLSQLEDGHVFDGVLSNFAGLNCVGDLKSVASDLAKLVRPGGMAVLCVFGRCCLWEMVWYLLHGDLKRAFRRRRAQGTVAQLAPGHNVYVRYPSINALRRDFSTHFRLVSWKGVGVAVPPSYLEPWVVRFPRLFKFAASIDSIVGRCPGFRALADHVVLVLERVGA